MKILFIFLAIVSVCSLANDKEYGGYHSKLESYGKPTLYYSEEGQKERRRLELLRESNDIERERLEIEREHLRNEQRSGRYYSSDD